ncbi:Cytochrome c family protein [Vibrio chagasii]|nr:Cytochrome c family protein [Vibrio chagasii]
MFIIRKFFLSLTLFASLIGIAKADVQYCRGYIEDWDLTRNGYFYVDSDWNDSKESQRICSIEGAFDDISAETCKIWISTVMSAAVAKKRVTMKYRDAVSCKSSDLGVWTNTVIAPEYIRVYSN